MADNDFANEALTPGAAGDKFPVIRGPDGTPAAWTDELADSINEASIDVDPTGHSVLLGSSLSTVLDHADTAIAGKVTGPSSATDNALARFDATTGKLIQNSTVTLNDTGAMTFPAMTAPSAPSPGNVTLYARDFGGRVMPSTVGALGRASPLQPFIPSNTISYVNARGGSSNVFDTMGVLLTVTGTATAAAMAATNYHSRVKRNDILVTTPSTSAVAGFRGASGQLWTVGGDVAGAGGFHYVCRWAGATGLTNGSHRGFMGLRSTTSAPTDVNPSTLTDIIGMGWDAADTFIQIMHNDGSGTATKVPTSLAKPSADRTDYYELSLFSPAGTTQEVYWRVTNLATGAEATGTVNSDLPTTTTFLNVFGQMSVGGVSSVIGMSISVIYIDYGN